MTSVTEWGSSGCFTAAKDNSLFFGKCNCLRKKPAFAVIAVAKGLFFRMPARTPRIASGFDVYRIRMIGICFWHANILTLS